MGHHNANPNSNGLSREVSEIIQGRLPGTDVSWEKEGNYVTDLVMCIYPYMYVHVGRGYYIISMIYYIFLKD